MGDKAFLDTSEINDGDEFPARMADAVLDARVMVIFANTEYFRSRYCRAERLLALAPRTAGARHVVAALVENAGPGVTSNLPGDMKSRSWPGFADTARIADMVGERLAELKLAIREYDPARAARLRAQVLAGLILPLPLPPGDIVAYPQPLPRSIHDQFVGREAQIAQLHQALWDGGSAAITGALRGGAGFGKSRLAAEYLRRYGPLHYTGGLFWLNAEGDVAREFHGMIAAIRRASGKEIAGLNEYAARAQAARRELEEELGADLGAELRALAGKEKRRVLFVADNVPETDSALARWCPALDEVTVLATCRADVPGVDHSFRVTALDEDAACELLTRNVATAGEIDAEGWRTIAGWVGCHARVLETLNGVLAGLGIRPRDLLASARSRAPLPEIAKQEKALRALVGEKDLPGIATALRVSYETLPESAQRAARLLAFLGPDAIPDVLVNRLIGEDDAMEVRLLLRARSWVEPVEAESGEMFGTVHRLLGEFLRSMSSDPAVEMLAVCKVLNDLLDPGACRDPKRWSELNPCAPHADHVSDCLLKLDAEGVEIADWEPVVRLGVYAAILREAQGVSVAARRTVERAVDLARVRLGAENQWTLTAMNNLAETLRAQGDLAGARKLHEGELEVCRRVQGAEHPSTLSSMNNLALTLKAQGDLAGARKLHEEVVEVRRRVLGAEHQNTLKSMINLANTLWAQGDLAGARKLQEETRDVLCRVLGAEHPDTLTAMNNLAATLKTQGDLAGARKLHEQVLEVRRRLLGEQHTDSSGSAWNLFRTLEDMGEHQAAQAVLDRHLLWLLGRDPASLGAVQRQFQGYLRTLPARGFRIK